MATPVTPPARLVCAALVAALALGAYRDTLRHGFVYDDAGVVLSNDAVSGAPSITRAFGRDFWGRSAATARDNAAYRPVATLTLALDWRVGRGAPWVFHLTNTLLHVFASLALLWALRARSGSWLTALAAASVFAAHTLHSDAVIPLAGRVEVLGALGAAAVYALHARHRVAASVALLATTLACESSAAVVALLALRELRDETAWRAWPSRFGGYAVALCLAAGLRWHALGTASGAPATALNPLVGASFMERAVTATSTFGRAARLTMAPLDLTPDYGPAAIVPSSRFDADTLLGALALATLVGLIAWSWRRRHWLGEAAAWTLLFGLIAANVPVLLARPFAERWWYLPSFAACALFGAAIARVERRLGTVAAVAALAVTVAALASVTDARVRTWELNDTLLLDAVLVEPNNARMQVAMAQVQIGYRALELARRRCARAATVLPRWSDPHGCLALIHERARRYDDADAAYAAMYARDEVSLERRAQHAFYLLDRGRTAEARARCATLTHDARDDRRLRALVAARCPSAERPSPTAP